MTCFAFWCWAFRWTFLSFLVFGVNLQFVTHSTWFLVNRTSHNRTFLFIYTLSFWFTFINNWLAFSFRSLTCWAIFWYWRLSFIFWGRPGWSSPFFVWFTLGTRQSFFSTFLCFQKFSAFSECLIHSSGTPNFLFLLLLLFFFLRDEWVPFLDGWIHRFSAFYFFLARFYLLFLLLFFWF